MSLIRDALGQIDVLSPDALNDRFLTDWSGDHLGQAIAVIRPRSVNEVREVMAFCSANGISVVPQGGNIGLVSGAITLSSKCVVANLELLNRIREIDERNFSATVEAGCALRSLKDAVETRALTFPLSLGSEGSCQIGGNIATNAGGVNVLRYVMMRDLMHGLEVVLPDGSLWNGLCALHKDNQGFDLNQLFIGGEGTIGILTSVCLKLFPIPDKVETAYVSVNSFADAFEFFSASYGHAGDGNVHFNALPPLDLPETEARNIGSEIEARIYRIVENFEGSISAEHGLGRTKRNRFAVTADVVHLRAMHGIKRTFDPENLMNPGCMLGECEAA